MRVQYKARFKKASRFRPCVIIIPPIDGTQEAECGVPRACGAATLEEVGSFLREPDKCGILLNWCRGLVTQASYKSRTQLLQTKRGNNPAHIGGGMRHAQGTPTLDEVVRFLRAPRYAWKITELVSRIVNNTGQSLQTTCDNNPAYQWHTGGRMRGAQHVRVAPTLEEVVRFLREPDRCEVCWVGVEDPLKPQATCAKVFRKQRTPRILGSLRHFL
ncbi:hypothetical protein B0H11DRAFT_1916805 [Mycena galericulata]|nr:hypothetical protein B0H11DRAFT_1916805 [Mycena galericulata]